MPSSERRGAAHRRLAGGERLRAACRAGGAVAHQLVNRSSGAWPATTASASRKPAAARPARPRDAPLRAPRRAPRRRSRSSITAKCGGTPASSGKRRSSDWQKAWMVTILTPPGASSTRANSRRARAMSVLRRRRGRSARAAPRRSRARRHIAQRRAVRRRGSPSRPPRRLGEGQAQDARRVGAVEQQAQHPVGQHLGLAGAGGGATQTERAGLERAALRVRRPAAACGSSRLLRRPRFASAFGERAEMRVIVVARRADAARGTAG